MEMFTKDSSLFVSVAAYRDGDTQNTVTELLNRAAYPQRIQVGVLSQIDTNTEKHLLVGSTSSVNELVVDYKSSKGAGWARSKIQTDLYSAQDYFLQVDAHSRFEYGWDELLAQMYTQINNPRGVISCYPPGFDIKTGYRNNHLCGFIVHRFDHVGLPQLMMAPRNNATGAAQLTAFMAGGCFFAPKACIQEVPYDPYIYFLGEETSMGIRLYTHGWDIYLPNKAFMYHQYKEVTYHNETHRGSLNVADINVKSIDRVRHLLGIQQSQNPDTIAEISNYGLGNARSIADWERFTGIHLTKQIISTAAMEGNYPCGCELF